MSQHSKDVDINVPASNVHAISATYTRTLALALISVLPEFQACAPFWASFPAIRLTSFPDIDALLVALLTQRFDFIVLDQEHGKQRLLDTIKQHQPQTRFVFIARDTYAPTLVKLLSRGHYFTCLNQQSTPEQNHKTLNQLFYPRNDKRQCIQGLTLIFDAAGQRWEHPLLDISLHGIAWRTDLSGSGSVLTPGKLIQSLSIKLGADIIFNTSRALVRHITPHANQFNKNYYRIGAEILPEQRFAQQEEKIFKDPITLTALIKQSSERSAFQVTRTAQDGDIYLAKWHHEPLPSAHTLSLQGSWPAEWQTGDVVRITFDLNNWGGEFYSTIDELSPNQVIRLKAPSILKCVRRRVFPRQYLAETTSFHIKFHIPFFGSVVNGKPSDLSTQGFSIDIDPQLGPLPPGTLIKSILVLGPQDYFSVCSGVVHYAHHIHVNNTCQLRCGIRFTQTEEKHTLAAADAIVSELFGNVKSGQGMSFDELWRFFYQSNFIYPKKEEAMRPILEQVQENFSRLVKDRESPILRTVVVNTGQDGLDAHMSLLLAYKHTCLVQHLASLGAHRDNKTAAKNVYQGTVNTLAQLSHAQWMRAYFQPQKASPDKLAGIFARRLDCSTLSNLSTYAYLTSTTTLYIQEDFSNIHEANEGDHALIHDFYLSGNALCELIAEDGVCDELELQSIQKIYNANNLKRRRRIFLMTTAGRVTGFSSLEFSSYGLNLSEVTNRCLIHAWENEELTISTLARHARVQYRNAGYPFCIIMIKPLYTSILTNIGFTYTRDYTCWTLHRSLFPEYVDYVETLFNLH